MNTTANGRAEAIAANSSHGLPLLPGHYIELVDGSGLSPDTIRAAGIYSEGDCGKLAAMLNRKTWSRAMGAGLVYPYRDESGAVVLQRIRPTNPQREKNGRPRKYLQPTGAPSRLYVPPAAFVVLQDASARLIITEGEKKSLCATQHGFHAVALPGVDCWHAKQKMTLLPDLDRIPWTGRAVYIAFDSDAAENREVTRSERELAAVLKSHGATVKIVRIPPGPPDTDGNATKQGIDDFIVAHGPGEFAKLIAAASDPEPPDAGEYLEPAADMDPAIEAEHILATVKLGELSRLRFWRGSWYWWAMGRYAEKPPEEVRGEVVNLLNRRYLGVRSRYVSDLLEHVRAKSMLPASVEPPTWLGKPPHGWTADECLATKNAIVHLPSLAEGRTPCEMPATPALLTTTATEFALDLQAPEPVEWFRFLDSLWEDDPQSIAALQEWFGYLLTHDTRQQKMLLLIGPKRSGKGTIARVLTALVGKGNVAAPTLGGLGTNFGLWPLIGKSVAIISDARLSWCADGAAVVERLLSVSGEDSITVDRKNMAPLTLRLPTRFVILSNELPRFTDASGAVVSRAILLHTNQSFYGREDHDLDQKLATELPGILLWAIGGWQRLRERGRFLQPDSGLESLGEMNDLASPISAFVRDCCSVGPAEREATARLFEAWQRWCQSQGREKFVGTVQAFGRDLLAAEPGVRRRQLREGEQRTRVYDGIGLRSGF